MNSMCFEPARTTSRLSKVGLQDSCTCFETFEPPQTTSRLSKHEFDVLQKC